MTDIVKIGSKLAVICAVAAIALGIVNAITEPNIIKMKKEKLEAALEKVSGGMKVGDYVAVKDNPIVNGYYPLSNSDNKITGYICRLTGIGYGGDLKLISGISSRGKILSAILLEDLETPGLGQEAEKQSYMVKYIGTGQDKPVPVRKTQLSPKDADAVTGASITFMGVGKALAAGSEYIKKLGGE